MNRTVLISAVLILSCAPTVIPQQRKSRAANRTARIVKQKPTVHISFVRFAKREPRHNDESDEGVWLRVHNNTRWPLTFYGMDWFIDEYHEMRVFYGVEKVPEPRGVIKVSVPPIILPPPPGSSQEMPTQLESVSQSKIESSKDCEAPPDDWGIDIVAPITLPPGRSMLFSVPREALCKNLKIYLKYNYSWEKHDRYRPFDYEPEHRLYFEGSELPKSSH